MFLSLEMFLKAMKWKEAAQETFGSAAIRTRDCPDPEKSSWFKHHSVSSSLSLEYFQHLKSENIELLLLSKGDFISSRCWRVQIGALITNGLSASAFVCFKLACLFCPFAAPHPSGTVSGCLLRTWTLMFSHDFCNSSQRFSFDWTIDLCFPADSLCHR